MARPKGSSSTRRRTSGQQNTLSFAAQPAKVTKPSGAAGKSTAAKAAETKANKLRLEAETTASATPSPAPEPAVVEIHPEEEQKNKKQKPADSREVPIRQQQPRVEQDDEVETETKPPEAVVTRSEDEEAALKVSDAQIKRYWKAKEESRIAPRVHQQSLSLHDKILREFDISSHYGPCVGISRAKRWKRARALGLNPPIEVLKVLMDEETKAGARAQIAYVDELLWAKNID